ncbi:MAG: hypothetical protein IBJ10_07505 [Phycisphaerales bacterium]|nr:hypothetical protein [Phycisphaerales bacterium]
MGDFHSRAGGLEPLPGPAGHDRPVQAHDEPTEVQEDEWSADAPPLPFMPRAEATPDGAADRATALRPWVKRAG